MNSVVSIVLAWAAFGKPLGVVQLLGLGLCVGGSAAYIFVETKKRKRVISS
jgi:drug/metabolite transporter (DMT)-like permease